MRKNQAVRRNLSDGWKIELEFGNKKDLLDIGKIAMAQKKAGNTNASKSTLSQNDKVDLPLVNTQKEISKAAGVSTGQVGMAEPSRSPFALKMRLVLIKEQHASCYPRSGGQARNLFKFLKIINLHFPRLVV